MPGRRHTAKRPSGSKHRKAKESRIELLKIFAGSMLQYVSRPGG